MSLEYKEKTENEEQIRSLMFGKFRALDYEEMTKIKEKIEKHSLWLQTAIIIVSLGYIY
jgi:hypothetical protein